MGNLQYNINVKEIYNNMEQDFKYCWCEFSKDKKQEIVDYFKNKGVETYFVERLDFSQPDLADIDTFWVGLDNVLYPLTSTNYSDGFIRDKE